jgi:hypothetical protein
MQEPITTDNFITKKLNDKYLIETDIIWEDVIQENRNVFNQDLVLELLTNNYLTGFL